MMSFVTKELTDVFSHEFSLYIMSTTQGGMQKKYLDLILEFVNFFGNEFIIFRQK
jgi:hypothetical protein